MLSGFGVGGGTLLLVYLTAVAGVDQHLAQGINLLELGIHFLLPFCVTCCICLRCLYCRRVRSELVPMLLSMVWTGLWTTRRSRAGAGSRRRTAARA